MIKDLNRSRKIYSFFRARPIALPLVTNIISGSGGDDVLTFVNITQLEAYDVITNATKYGAMGFVQTVKDYFSFNPGASDAPDHIAIASATGGGRWFRCNIQTNQWRDQTNWFIDANGGFDENTGADTGNALQTHDEFSRRVLNTTYIQNHYNIILSGSVIAKLGLNAQFDGGKLNYVGEYKQGSAIGVVAQITSSTHAGTSLVPKYVITGLTGHDIDYGLTGFITGGQFTSALWTQHHSASTIFTAQENPFGGFVPLVGNTIYSGSLAEISLSTISVSGPGRLQFNTVSVVDNGSGSTIAATELFNGDEVALNVTSTDESSIILQDSEFNVSNIMTFWGPGETLLINSRLKAPYRPTGQRTTRSFNLNHSSLFMVFGTPYFNTSLYGTCAKFQAFDVSFLSFTGSLSQSDCAISYFGNGSTWNYSTMLMADGGECFIRDLTGSNHQSFYTQNPPFILNHDCTLRYLGNILVEPVKLSDSEQSGNDFVVCFNSESTSLPHASAPFISITESVRIVSGAQPKVQANGG